MSSPFIGEIRMFGGNFAPRNNAFCNGQLVNIQQNTALFSILGTTYGGNGTTTFALPDLQGRVPIHMGSGAGLSPYSLGQSGGLSDVTLTSVQLGAHNHFLQGVDTATATAPAASVQLGANTDFPGYLAAAPSVAMNASAIAPAVGGGGSHTNVQPILAVNFIIAMFGIFPSRN